MIRDAKRERFCHIYEAELGLLETPFSSDGPYREAVDSLLYFSVGTRSDIPCIVARVAKLVERPTIILWNCVKMILSCFTSTHDLGLKYRYKQEPSPTVYVDVDRASDISSRKSVRGMVTIMAGAAVSCYSRQQEGVALSSAEAEYISLCFGAK